MDRFSPVKEEKPMVYCPNCGAQLPDGSQFCGGCGSSLTPARTQASGGQMRTDPHGQFANWPRDGGSTAPAQAKKQKKSGKGRFPLGIVVGALLTAAVVAVMAVLGVISFGKGGGRIQGKGYDSPEAAAKAYVEAWSKGDLDAMLATFLVESYVDNFDLAARNNAYARFLTRIYDEQDVDMQYSGYNFGVSFPLKSSKLSKDLSIHKRADSIISSLCSQLMQYAYHDVVQRGELTESGDISSFESEADYQTALRLLEDPELFTKVSFVSAKNWQEIIPAAEQEERWKHSLLSDPDYRAALGLEEWTETAVELTIGGRSWLLFLSQVKIDGRWYNYSFNSNLASYCVDDVGAYKNGLVPKP